MEQNVFTWQSTPARFDPAPSSIPLTVQVREVVQVLSRVNTKKMAGPDGTLSIGPTRFQRSPPRFTTFFWHSLPSQPDLFIPPLSPYPRDQPQANSRLVAHTTIITECLARLILPVFLPQLTYRANRSTEDSIAMTLHTALSHLEQ